MNYLFIAILLFAFNTRAQSVIVTYAEKDLISKERLNAMPESYRNAWLAQMEIPKLFVLQCSENSTLYKRDSGAKDFYYENEVTPSADNDYTEGRMVVDKKITEFFY